MENKINTGLDLEKQELDLISNHKLLMGAVSNYPILKKDANWMDVWLKIKPETQFGARVETMGCTGYGTANILEMLFKWQYNKDFNISDRALNKMSGTTPRGNTVDAPIDTIRKQGFLLEEEWGWNRDTFDWNTYYSPIPYDLLAKAKARLDDWDFAHEYVPTYNKDGIIEALKTSPIGGTVPAWYKDSNGIYHDYGHNPNHYSVVIIGYEYGKYWLCADSYPDDFQYNDNPQQGEFIKKLDWNFRFGCLKRYKITNKITSKKKLYLQKYTNMFKAYFDNHGLHVYWVDPRGKQEIPLETTADKALFMQWFKDGSITKTSWPELVNLPDFKFF